MGHRNTGVVGRLGNQGLSLCISVLIVVMAGRSDAAPVKIAVYGDNATDNYINAVYGAGSAVVVTNAQLATAGFLTSNGFTAVYYTRDGLSFGASMSAAAAANVKSFVGASGNVTLLNGDFADALPGDAWVAQLTRQAVDFAVMSGNGFIGEFNGAAAGLTSNSNSLQPLAFITGHAGVLAGGGGGSAGSIIITAAGLTHPVTGGLGNHNPAAVEFGATYTGVPSHMVLARYDNGNPAVVSLTQAVVPLPAAAWGGMALMGAIGTNSIRRRRKGALC